MLKFVKEIITKEEIGKFKRFANNLNKWYEMEENFYDDLTKLYYDRTIGDIYAILNGYKKNELLDIEYIMNLTRGNMFNLLEDYRKTDKKRYNSFKKIYDLCYDIELR